MQRVALLFLPLLLLCFTLESQERKRIRDYGLEPGIMETGKWNAITDVPGVLVGHQTLIQGR